MLLASVLRQALARTGCAAAPAAATATAAATSLAAVATTAVRQGGLLALSPAGPLALAGYSVQVVVPALGDSVSDGVIAALLKKAGDPVAENETLAQIETDKVTIDIKAPSDGTVLGVVVQESETVVPGQLVCTIDDAAAKERLIGAKPPPGVEPVAAQAEAVAAPAASSSGQQQHRVPGIRFPPRVTTDGRRVSSLPAAEARAIVQAWRSSGAAAPATAAADAADHAASGAPAAAAKAPLPQPAAAGASRPAAARGGSLLEAMPPRRLLTDAEMELIELGGAGP